MFKTKMTPETQHASADDLQIFYRQKECGLAVRLFHHILVKISRLHLGTETRYTHFRLIFMAQVQITHHGTKDISSAAMSWMGPVKEQI